MQLSELEHGKKVTIGCDLDATIMGELMSCLSRNIDIFAWKVEDMPGMNPKVAVYKLNVNSDARPIKQSKRWFAPKRRKVRRKEIAKLVNA